MILELKFLEDYFTLFKSETPRSRPFTNLDIPKLISHNDNDKLICPPSLED